MVVKLVCCVRPRCANGKVAVMVIVVMVVFVVLCSDAMVCLYGWCSRRVVTHTLSIFVSVVSVFDACGALCMFDVHFPCGRFRLDHP